MKKLFCLLLMIASSFAALAQTSIAGVAFGSDYTSAKNILENKYGQQKWDSDKNCIHFENKEYGGIYFNDLFFEFQYSGTRGYFNKCVFVIWCNNANEAKRRRDNIASAVSKYYDLHEKILDNGFKIYQGGDDPTNMDNYGFYIDVLVPSGKGTQYGARLFYGPYNYVTENF